MNASAEQSWASVSLHTSQPVMHEMPELCILYRVSVLTCEMQGAWLLHSSRAIYTYMYIHVYAAQLID